MESFAHIYINQYIGGYNELGNPTNLRNGKIFTSLGTAFILIGSIISSTLLFGLTISPQQAWAALPTAPTLTAPSNGQVIGNDRTPTFDWGSVTASPSVTAYRVVVDNNNDFSSPEINITVSASPTDHTPSADMAFGTYSWKVRAINSEGAGPFSSVRTVTVALPSPALVSPSDGASTNDQTPTFTWNRVTGASSYQLQVDTSNAGPTDNCSPPVSDGGFGFSSPTAIDVTVADPGSGTTVSFTPTTELGEDNYFWHVRSITGSVNGCYSSERDLNINDNVPPVAPTLLSPANGAFTNDQTPLFDWNDASDPSGIDRYKIQVSTSSTLSGGAGTGFSSALIDTDIDDPPIDSQFTPGSNLAAGTYFWHVSATDGEGNTGLYGSTFSFIIDTAAPTQIPVLVAPSNGATINDNTPLFDWNDVTNPGTPASPLLYELRVDTTNPLVSPFTISELSLSSSTFTPSSALPDGTYFWNVRAKDTAGNLGPAPAAANTFSFTIDTTAPNTILDSVIDGNTNPVTNDSITKSDSLTFAFSGTPGSDVNHFACTLDSPTEINPCVSPKQFTGLSDTLHTFSVAAVDAAGNRDQSPIIFKWTVDTIPPDAPVITDPVAGTQNTAISSITGTAEEDATVQVFDGTTSLGTTTADASGDWTLTLGTALGDGTYSLIANATDTAGNPGPASSPAVAVTVDTTIAAPVITDPVTGTQNTAISEISGTSEASGLTVQVFDGATSLGTTTSGAGGDWTLTLGTALGDGEYSFTATASDGVNTSPTSPAVAVTVDTSPTAIDTSISLQLSGNNKVQAGATFTASGKLINAVADSPIAGETITFKIDGSTVSSIPSTVTTDSKGKFTAQLTAPTTAGKYNVQANFGGDLEFNPSSIEKKLTVEGTTTLTTTAATAIDTSMSLKVDGKDKMAGGADFTVSGKLIDSVSKKPISGKDVSVTTDGDSGSDTTNSKGEFEVDLKAPDGAGKHDVNAQFSGDAQYKSSESSVKITVEETTLSTQKNTVTTNQETTDEETDEQTDE